MKSLFYISLILCFLATGCAQDRQKISISQSDMSRRPQQAAAKPSTATAASIQTMARINGQPITITDLQPMLIEASGGQILRETILGMQLRKALGKTLITDEQIQLERAMFLHSLNPDPALAEQLLKQLRDREGLGARRFGEFLFRQAALRHLVQPEVTVSDAAVSHAYELKYGPSYLAQIITVDNAATAVQVLNRARRGEDFGKLVQEFSRDPASRVANGMLDPISPADSTYPSTVRLALGKLQPGQISDVVALDNGFAILKLVSKNQRQSVPLDDVKASLVAKVRHDVEQMLMRRLAATLMRQADVVVLDRELNRSWQQSKRNLPVESTEP